MLDFILCVSSLNLTVVRYYRNWDILLWIPCISESINFKEHMHNIHLFIYVSNVLSEFSAKMMSSITFSGSRCYRSTRQLFHVCFSMNYKCFSSILIWIRLFYELALHKHSKINPNKNGELFKNNFIITWKYNYLLISRIFFVSKENDQICSQIYKMHPLNRCHLEPAKYSRLEDTVSCYH